jgi:hypothetical protein
MIPEFATEPATVTEPRLSGSGLRRDCTTERWVFVERGKTRGEVSHAPLQARETGGWHHLAFRPSPSSGLAGLYWPESGLQGFP